MMSGLLIKGLLITQAAAFQNIQEKSFSFRNIRFDSKYFCFIRKNFCLMPKHSPSQRASTFLEETTWLRCASLSLSLSPPLSLSRSLSLSRYLPQCFFQRLGYLILGGSSETTDSKLLATSSLMTPGVCSTCFSRA